MWLPVAIEPKKDRRVLFAPTISKVRNMLVAKKFLSDLVNIYGWRPVTTDNGTGYTHHAGY
jgi:hypothetical protein